MPTYPNPDNQVRRSTGHRAVMRSNWRHQFCNGRNKKVFLLALAVRNQSEWHLYRYSRIHLIGHRSAHLDRRRAMGGVNHFYSKFYKECLSVTSSYFSVIDNNFFHIGDEMLTSLAFARMKNRGLEYLDAGMWEINLNDIYTGIAAFINNVGYEFDIIGEYCQDAAFRICGP